MAGFFVGMTAVLLGIVVSAYWILGRLGTFYGLNVKTPLGRVLRALAALGVLALSYLWRMVGLVAVHLAVIFLLTELAALLLRRVLPAGRGKKLLGKLYRTGLVPVVLTAALLLWGGWNMARVTRTDYRIESTKLENSYRIVFLSDTHFGTIQSPQTLERVVEDINALCPDGVILGGDMVEEGTTKAAMEEAFRLLGGLRATYGIYYVYGNHDAQHYTSTPAYTPEELERAIESNGITILQDSWVPLGDELVLAGRDDAGSRTGRKATREVLAGAERGRYVLLADHQPVGAEENAAQGVDLQLSGHTHAGQLWPIGVITTLTGGLNYGQYQVDGCRVIVSSGVAGWGFPIRTQGRSEYVVVDLVGTPPWEGAQPRQNA